MALRLYGWAAQVGVHILLSTDLSDERMRELYAFSNSLMEETFNSFQNHMRLNDAHYVFRDGAKRIVGLSSWRTVSTADPTVKMIVQGKLRVAIAFRRRGLHLVAGLAYYIRQQIRNLRSTFLFISIASLYNFVSMKKSNFLVLLDELRADWFSIHTYWILNRPQQQHSRLLAIAYATLMQLIADDHFKIMDDDGAIYVHVRIADSIIKEFPAAFYESPEAQEYIKANPRWREAYDLAYSYPFSILNILAMLMRLARMLLHYRFPRMF